jgi:GT2 family glycosyltransferase
LTISGGSGSDFIRNSAKLGVTTGGVGDDWLIVDGTSGSADGGAGNDMLITKDFPIERFEYMDDEALYSFVYVKDALYGFEYIENWMLFTPRKVYEGIGKWWDEAFAPMWFEAADYAIRAKKAGYRWHIIDRDDWGIYHREEERMAERKAYMKENMSARLANREYLMRKHGISKRTR